MIHYYMGLKKNFYQQKSPDIYYYAKYFCFTKKKTYKFL